MTTPDEISQEIESILMNQPVDLNKLRSISRKPGGFQSNKLRARVWPKLLGINRYKIDDYRSFVETHRDDNQVNCDVERSLWNSEPMKFWKEDYRERRRKVLAEIIIAILCRNKSMYYYQGYHDIVSTIMLVVDENHLAFAIAESISKHYLTDYMKENFEIICKFMQILMFLIKTADQELYDHLAKGKLEPFFAISWLITWFSHDIKSLEEVARVYDVFISSHPLFCFYISAAYVLELKDTILQIEPDFSALHDALAKAPINYGIQFEKILKVADDLYLHIPISKVLLSCNMEVLTLISNNEISMLKYSNNKKFVDADWKLLENVNLTREHPPNTYSNINQYVRNVWKKSWVWFWSTDSMSLDEEDSIFSLTLPLSMTIEYIMYSLLLRFKLLSPKIYYSLKARSKVLPASRGALFWSITALIGGILAYALMSSELPPPIDPISTPPSTTTSIYQIFFPTTSAVASPEV